MSEEHRIVCEVVRDHLRYNVPLRSEECWCRIEERVPPFAGEHFVSIYPGEYSPGPAPDISEAQDRNLGFSIGITQRTGLVPLDRMWRYAYLPDKGAATLAEKINRILERDRWQLLAAFNCAQTTWDYVEPLRLSSPDLSVRIVDHEHFTAPTDIENPAIFERYYGLFTNLTYTVGRIMRSFLHEAPVCKFEAIYQKDGSIKLKNYSTGTFAYQYWTYRGQVIREHSPTLPPEALCKDEMSITLDIIGPGGTDTLTKTLRVQDGHTNQLN